MYKIFWFFHMYVARLIEMFVCIMLKIVRILMKLQKFLRSCKISLNFIQLWIFIRIPSNNIMLPKKFTTLIFRHFPSLFNRLRTFSIMLMFRFLCFGTFGDHFYFRFSNLVLYYAIHSRSTKCLFSRNTYCRFFLH